MATKKQSPTARLIEVAKKIAENIDSYERELGRPVNETFVHPSFTLRRVKLKTTLSPSTCAC